MNRRTFLTELKTQLSGRIPRNEVKNILADYQQRFDAGIAGGKSEQELCEQFGSTQEIVRGLLKQRRTSTLTAGLNGSWLYWKPMLLITVLIFLPVFIAFSMVVSEEFILFTLPQFYGTYEIALFATLVAPLAVMCARRQVPENLWSGFRHTKSVVTGMNIFLLLVNLCIQAIAIKKVLEESARNGVSFLSPVGSTGMQRLLHVCFIGTQRLDGVMLVVLTTSLFLISISWWLYLRGSRDKSMCANSFVYAGVQWTFILLITQFYGGAVPAYSYPAMLLESSVPILLGVVFWALSRRAAREGTKALEMVTGGKMSEQRTVFVTAVILVMLLLQQAWQIASGINDIVLEILVLFVIPGLFALTAGWSGSPGFIQLTQGIYKFLNICAVALILVNAPAMIYVLFVFQRYHLDWETSSGFAMLLQGYWVISRLASLLFLAWWLHTMRGGKGAAARAAHFLYAGAALFVSLMTWLRLTLDDPDMVWKLIWTYLRWFSVGGALALVAWRILVFLERKARADRQIAG